MSRHGTVQAVLGHEIELRVKDNDGYDPTVLIFVRQGDHKREVEVDLFYSEAMVLRDHLADALAECERICVAFRASFEEAEA